MIGTETVPETSVIFKQLTQLLAQEDFSKLSVLCVYHYNLELQITAAVPDTV